MTEREEKTKKTKKKTKANLYLERFLRKARVTMDYAPQYVRFLQFFIFSYFWSISNGREKSMTSQCWYSNHISSGLFVRAFDPCIVINNTRFPSKNLIDTNTRYTCCDKPRNSLQLKKFPVTFVHLLLVAQ